jgi:ubiquinone biosynthesis monooxygenase Coq7
MRSWCRGFGKASLSATKRSVSHVTVKPVLPNEKVFSPPQIKDMIRVDLAGEMAAVRICEAQKWWVSPLSESRVIIDEILEEEEYHRETMWTLCEKYDVEPTVADPIFKAGAFVMGLGTAALGKNAIMCCHAAVEETITDHYNSQLRELESMRNGGGEPGEPSPASDSGLAGASNASTQGNEGQSASASSAAVSAPSYPPQERQATEEELKEATLSELSSIIAKFRDDEQHHQELGEQNGSAQAPFYPLLYPAIQSACKFGITVASKW